MMKNFKKFTAFVLTLCMLLSLSVAAFAAEPETHTVYDSALTKKSQHRPKQPPLVRSPAVRSSGS